MLIVARKLSELHFDKLMMVYQQGNEEKASILFPNESYDRQLMLAEEEFRRYLLEDFFRQKNAAYYIWEEARSYRSALRLEPYQDGLLLEALETRPDSRNKGYAKALIQEVFETTPPGTKVYSHVSKRNKPSLKVHYDLGFEKILDHAVELDGTVTSKDITLCVTL